MYVIQKTELLSGNKFVNATKKNIIGGAPPLDKMLPRYGWNDTIVTNKSLARCRVIGLNFHYPVLMKLNTRSKGYSRTYYVLDKTGMVGFANKDCLFYQLLIPNNRI